MAHPTSKSWLPPYLATGVVWGCSFLFIKYALVGLSPFGVAFARSALGALTLIVLARLRGARFPRERAVWGHLWVLALCYNVVPGILFAVAETRTTSIVAGLVNAMTPLTTLFFTVVIFRDEPVTREQQLGLGIGLVGILVVLGVWQGLGSNPWWAVLALVGSVVLYGITFPYSRRHLVPRKLEPVAIAQTQLVLATATLLPFFLVDGWRGHVSASFVVGTLCLGIFSSGFAYAWNFRVIADAGGPIASTVTYIAPVVAVAAGLLFLHERLTWFEPVGGVIVLLGAAVGQGRLRRLPVPQLVRRHVEVGE